MRQEQSPFDIAFATIDFQGDVRVTGDIPTQLQDMLNTVAFPVSGPFSLSQEPGFYGYKIFAVNHWLCIIRFFDAGKRDAYQRAVPSAKSIIAPLSALDAGLRDFSRLRRFLDETDFASISQNILARDFWETVVQPAPFESRGTFVRYLDGSSITVADLTRVLARLLVKGQLIIGGLDPSERLAFFGLLFLLVPHQIFERDAWCTYAAQPEAQHEEVVCARLAADKPKPSKLGWLKRMAGLMEDNAIPMVDTSQALLVGFDHLSNSTVFA